MFFFIAWHLISDGFSSYITVHIICNFYCLHYALYINLLQIYIQSQSLLHFLLELADMARQNRLKKRHYQLKN